MFSAISIGKIQHWLDTPLGDIYGYPSYGNNIEQLLFINRQKAPFVLGLILNKIEKDLGRDVAEDIKEASVVNDKNRHDTFYVAIVLKSGIAIGEYHV